MENVLASDALTLSETCTCTKKFRHRIMHPRPALGWISSSPPVRTGILASIYTILYYITIQYSTLHDILLSFGATLALSRILFVDAYDASSFRQQAAGEELKSLDKKLEVACGFGEAAHGM